MAKSQTYKVINNRIQYKCVECHAKRNLPVPPNVRSRSVRCHKCGELSRCKLNRRQNPRQLQSGKVIVITRQKREIEVQLHDISPEGVGFDVAVGATRSSIALKQEIKFRCGWNPRLFGRGQFIVQNIKGNRIGAQNIAQNIIR